MSLKNGSVISQYVAVVNAQLIRERSVDVDLLSKLLHSTNLSCHKLPSPTTGHYFVFNILTESFINYLYGLVQ